MKGVKMNISVLTSYERFLTSVLIICSFGSSSSTSASSASTPPSDSSATSVTPSSGESVDRLAEGNESAPDALRLTSETMEV